MASKLIAICAFACAIQGLNAALFFNAERSEEGFKPQIVENSLQHFQTLEQEYAQILDNFENVVINTEAEGPEAEFAGYFENLLELDGYLNGENLGEDAEGADKEVIRKCIQEQRPAFEKLRETIRRRVIDARVALRQYIYQTLGPYVQKARQAFRVLAREVALFPARIYKCIQDRDFVAAIKVIRQTREVVRTNAAVIGENIRLAREQFPAIREKARQMREQIQKEAREGMAVIRNAIRECIKNGGPAAFIPEEFPAQQEIVEPVPVEVSNLLLPADAAVSRD